MFSSLRILGRSGISSSPSSLARRGARTMGSLNKVTNDVCSVMSIPVSLGQPFLGADNSPQLLKDHGLLPVSDLLHLEEP